MIHRDHRKHDESSSGYGQIIRIEGPAEMSATDIDLLTAKISRARFLVHEHKQPGQAFVGAQNLVLQVLDAIIEMATMTEPSERLKHLLGGSTGIWGSKSVTTLDPESGVYVIRGNIGVRPEDTELIRADGSPGRQVTFLDRQTVTRVGQQSPKEFESRKQMFDWMNGGADWSPRKGIGRQWGN
jgi:hypothetical protein